MVKARLLEKNAPCRIVLTVPPEMLERVGRVARVMGTSDTAAARYLLMRGLSVEVGTLAANSSANALESMVNLFEGENARQEAKRQKGKKGQIRAIVTPGLETKNGPVGEIFEHD